jgi:tyrosyl-tRNA synthetase
MPNDVLSDLEWRGLVAECTDRDRLRAALAEGPLTYYCGFDPTAPSLHLGNLVQVLTLRRLQLAGNRPLALVGGATGLIGDPKPAAERALNEPEVVSGWVERYRQQIEPYLDFTGAHAAQMVNNLDWTADLSAIDLLRDVGKHFRVNKMLAKEAVSARLESDSGISYTEFSYQILQAHDFLQLYRRYGCLLQTGGSDQWGNLTAGLDLLHRVEGVTAHALATPLVTKSDGTKFGKTETGTVWLDPEMTSPYTFFQFWMNADDRDALPYLKIFSFRSPEEIDALGSATEQRPAAREAQRALAEELTELVHGADALATVQAATEALFGAGDLRGLDAATLTQALEGAPSATSGVDMSPLPSLLVELGLCKSTSDARSRVTQGGVYLNGARVEDPTYAPTAGDLLHGRFLVLRVGKRSYGVVEVST